MRIRWVFGEPEPAGRAVTVGNFDGVHVGHRRILARLVEAAGARALVPSVLLFDPHPLAVLAPERVPERLTSIPRRIELIRRCGIPSVGVIEFDKAAAVVEAEAFVRDVLARQVRARLVVASRDFRFGSRRRGDIAMLREMGPAMGLGTLEVPTVEAAGGPASSTRIRQMLRSGDVAGAARLLGRPHVVSGVVEHGAARGRSLGFPTANLGPTETMTPGEGIYAAWARWDAEPRPAAVHVGRRLTFDGVFAVEAHVLDLDEDLYGRTMEIGFVERLRDDVRFDGAEALATQIRKDVEDVRRLSGGICPDGTFPCALSGCADSRAGAA